MPRWVLGCPECKQDFTHSEITLDQERHDFDAFLNSIVKPQFPVNGLELECPNCRQKSVYYRHQLIYRK
jgi:hypothetical protein